MFKKSVLSLLLAVVIFTMLFTGCKNGTSGNGDNKEGADTKAVRIGIINYDYSGEQGAAFKEYLKYLEKDKELNVKFIFSISQANDEEHIKAVDALITQGVDGIISSMDMAQEAIIKACEEAGVYYANTNASNPDVFDKVKKSKFFLGQVADGKVDGTELGEIAAKIVMDNKFKHVGVTSFPQKMIKMQEQVDKAFRQKLKQLDTEGTVEVYKTHEHFFDGSGIDTYINSHPEQDAEFAIGSGLQYDYPKIVAAGKKGKVKLISVGMATDKATLQEFKDGNIVMGTASSVESVAGPLALMIDKLNGNQYKDFKGAEQFDSNPVIVSNYEDAINFSKYTFGRGGKPIISTEKFKELMVTFNKDATFAGLKDQLTKLDLKTAVEVSK